MSDRDPLCENEKKKEQTLVPPFSIGDLGKLSRKKG
jgi:hypothetical protein